MQIQHAGLHFFLMPLCIHNVAHRDLGITVMKNDSFGHCVSSLPFNKYYHKTKRKTMKSIQAAQKCTAIFCEVTDYKNYRKTKQ